MIGLKPEPYFSMKSSAEVDEFCFLWTSHFYYVEGIIVAEVYCQGVQNFWKYGVSKVPVTIRSTHKCAFLRLINCKFAYATQPCSREACANGPPASLNDTLSFTSGW